MGHLRIFEARSLLTVELSPEELDVGVDEAQFYPDLREAIAIWMAEGRRVYIAALDGDFRRNIFPPIARALSLATRIVKLTAICMMCSSRRQQSVNEANYTIRTISNESVELIGAQDIYKAACLSCYLRHAEEQGV